MRCDFHMHSLFSGDGKATIDEMCAAAIEKGFGAVCFTEHHDLGQLTEAAQRYIEEHWSVTSLFRVDEPEKYTLAIMAAREKYPQLKVMLGIEFAIADEMDMAGFGVLDKLPLDYLLASCHDAGSVDPAMLCCYDGRTRCDIVTAYYRSMYEGLKALETFDSLAHIGYVYRYLKRYEKYEPAEREYRRSDAPDIIDAILRRVIDDGAVLELNMSGFSAGYTMPDIDIIKRYAQLGGEAMIYASDAHEPKNIGQHYDAAVEIMKNAKIKYLASFDKRKASFAKI